MSNNSLFITFEGIDGSGKSSSIIFTRKILEQSGKRVIITREPGGTEIGEHLRKLLLNFKYHQNPSVKAELLMLFAARAENLKKNIIPALKRGDHVICDRFTDSTYAYQGGGYGINKKKIKILNSFIQGKNEPNVTILLDLPVSISLKRVLKRSTLDYFEVKRFNFFKRVRQSYLTIAAKNPERIFTIDASMPLPKVQKEITLILHNIVKKKK